MSTPPLDETTPYVPDTWGDGQGNPDAELRGERFQHLEDGTALADERARTALQKAKAALLRLNDVETDLESAATSAALQEAATALQAGIDAAHALADAATTAGEATDIANARAQAAIAALIGSAPPALDTWAEFVAELGRLSSVDTNLVTTLAQKANSADVPSKLTVQANTDAIAAFPSAYQQVWRANTTYASGVIVVSPSGQLVQANSAFTSGATYNAANWTVIASGGGSSVALKPSGDTTGATDVAAINSALSSTGSVVLGPGSWYINASIVMPSRSAMVLINAIVTLVAQSNCPIVRNTNMDATGNDDIRITGLGGSRFIGQAGALFAAASVVGATTLSLAAPVAPGTYYCGASFNSNVETVNVVSVSGTSAPYTATLASPTTIAHGAASWLQTQYRDQAGNRWATIALLFVNVRGLTLEGFAIGPTNFLMVNPQGCTDVVVRRIRLIADGVSLNQDGVDLFGCQRAVVEDITGNTGDDFSYCMSHYTTPAVHPYLRTSATMPDTTDIVYRNIAVIPGINFIRLIAGDGKKIYGVSGHNLTALGTVTTAAMVKIGDASYVSTIGDATSIQGVQFTGVRPNGLKLLSLDLHCSGIRISDVLFDHTGFGTAVGFLPSSSLTNGTFNDITIDGVTFARQSVTSSALGDFVVLRAGSVMKGLSLRNMRLFKAKGLLNNPAGITVSGVDISNVSIGTLFAPLVGGAAGETGSMTNVSVDAINSGVTAFSAATPVKLRLGGVMPDVVTGDVVPSPTRGSRIIAKAGVDPTGGSSAQGAEYIGDGTAWNRGTVLAN